MRGRAEHLCFSIYLSMHFQANHTLPHTRGGLPQNVPILVQHCFNVSNFLIIVRKLAGNLGAEKSFVHSEHFGVEI